MGILSPSPLPHAVPASMKRQKKVKRSAPHAAANLGKYCHPKGGKMAKKAGRGR